MGFFDKLKKITTNLFSSFTEADEAFFEELEETLILADLGMDTALDAVEKLRTRVRKEKLRDQEEVREALREVLVEEMAVGDTALDLSTSPSVVLFIGVNGVGKTTSIGKLAHQLRSQGKRVLLCAADTFRAAAADQLQIWAERAGCELIRQHEGADPGAVLFDASRLPRPGMWMWCCATPPDGSTTRQTSWQSSISSPRSSTGSAPALPGRRCWCWTPPPDKTG